MIYIGNNEISNIYVGTEEIIGIYAGDLQIYPTDFGIVTAISLENLVWVTDVPYSGGTADSGNCSFSVIAYYDNGKSKQVTNSATISGSLIVPETTAETREMVGTLTLTATYSGFTDSGSVDVYQAAYSPCNPKKMIDYLGVANNVGHYKANMYWFDSGLTEITSCDYDWTGIKCLCSRTDGFYITPNALLGDGGWSSASGDSLSSITYFEADTPDLQRISYPFGADRTTAVSQSLTSCTITSTNNVTYIRQMFRYCTNLVNLKLGDLSNASSAEKGHFQGCYNLQNVEIEALPNEDMSSGNSTSSWCWNQATALTETSLINILNALPSGGNSKKCGIGATNLAKLTSVAGQTALTNAQNKGWIIN